MSQRLKSFIPLAVAITLLSGIVYGAGQQILRTSANDPQIQFAQDIAVSLNNGVFPQAIIPPARVDMSKSLSIFIMVFNNKKNLTVSTGEIQGKVPEVPSGVFDYVSKNGEDRITWQPERGVRNATVVTKYKNGYVLVGRSLKEVEARTGRLLQMVVVGWAVTLVAAFAAVMLITPKHRRG